MRDLDLTLWKHDNIAVQYLQAFQHALFAPVKEHLHTKADANHRLATFNGSTQMPRAAFYRLDCRVKIAYAGQHEPVKPFHFLQVVDYLDIFCPISLQRRFQAKEVAGAVVKYRDFGHYIAPFVLGTPFLFLSMLIAMRSATANALSAASTLWWSKLRSRRLQWRSAWQPELTDRGRECQAQRGLCSVQNRDI